MNRTTAIVITVVTALLCGCPGLALAALGVMAVFGSQMPEVMAQNPSTPEEALLGAGMFICVGGVLVLIPVIAGILSFRYASPASQASTSHYRLPHNVDDEVYESIISVGIAMLLVVSNLTVEKASWRKVTT